MTNICHSKSKKKEFVPNKIMNFKLYWSVQSYRTLVWVSFLLALNFWQISLSVNFDKKKTKKAVDIKNYIIS